MTSLRVLVADGDCAVRRGICKILESRESLVVCGQAANGTEAIEKAKTLEPDLVVLDVSMPILEGFDAAKRIRELFPTIAILVLSIQDSKRLIEEAKNVGISGYATKSRAAITLLNAVDAVLRNEGLLPG
jgi:DNA-binding NarL/FixJ family response regulator